MVEETLLNMPAEMVEELLLNLPIKSLLRFSSVSKTWKSIIFESEFGKRYRGRERIVLQPWSSSMFLGNVSTCPLSSISSDNPAVEATGFVCPFSRHPSLKALCDELWLARDANSLFLWNPSMRTYKKLPHSSILRPKIDYDDFVYGLGYESVVDDYKILKIPRAQSTHMYRVELYSLRSDSWRNIQSFPSYIDERKRGAFESKHGVFVSGKLHWMSSRAALIISFDLSTEKFGEVALPNYSLAPTTGEEEASFSWDVTVLRGILCVSLNYYKIINYDDKVCIIWVMEDYGVAESWTKKFSVKCCNSIVRFRFGSILPLYFYENGEILVRVSHHQYGHRLFVYKDEKTTPQEVIYSSSCDDIIFNGFLYVDSLVSPAMWSTVSKSYSIGK